MKKYGGSVLKEKLSPVDRIYCDDQGLTFNDAKVDYCTPRDSPLQLLQAADKKIDDLLEGEIIEDQVNWSIWCFCAIFLPMVGKPGYSFSTMEKILRKFKGDDVVFLTIDLTESYSQIPVHGEERNWLSFIVPHGKL